MTLFDLGSKHVALCNDGKNMEVINSFYDDNIVSIEAASNPGTPDMPRTMEGIDSIRGKNTWWYDNHEVHAGKVTGPFPHGDDRYALMFEYDVTFKPASQRMQFQEVGVFTVNNNKIVKEEFYYHMG